MKRFSKKNKECVAVIVWPTSKANADEIGTSSSYKLLPHSLFCSFLLLCFEFRFSI